MNSFSAACIIFLKGNSVNPNMELPGVEEARMFYRRESPWYSEARKVLARNSCQDDIDFWQKKKNRALKKK
ncbi:MAG: hypothetical protein WAU31_03070 [Candidatus Moraniibacteriota bacterium]